MELSHIEKNSSLPDKNRISGRKLVLISLSAFFALISIVFLVGIRLALTSDTIYKGVRIQGKDVGGFSKEELLVFLEEHYAKTFDSLTLTLVGPQFERNVSVSELGIGIDIKSMTEAAYGIGRKGGILQRIAEILKIRNHPVSINPIIDFETESFNKLLDITCQSVFREITPPNIIISEESVVLCTGLPGMECDRNALKADIVGAVENMDSKKIIIPVAEKPPPPIDVETTMNTLNQEPLNAEFVKTSRTTYEIRPHQLGRKLERARLMDIINYVERRENKEYEEIVLPVEFIAPDLTEEELKARLFRDTLSSCTTHFNTNTENNYNRGVNIRLAAESIDGTILLPGEEFSFNDVVGPRTPQKGYKTAHIFVEGQIRDGTGGGVCQVSTTLYNAVLKANLEVTERHNHMFIVGYVPLGQDAAVSYGYADLVFKNTTAHPIRINASVSAYNNLTFKIVSTNDYPNLRIKIASKTISTTPFTVQYIDDNTMPQGTAVVVENGSNGYVVDTFIRVYNGDALIREEKLHRSVYQMHPRKIIRGTAPTVGVVEEGAED